MRVRSANVRAQRDFKPKPVYTLKSGVNKEKFDQVFRVLPKSKTELRAVLSFCTFYRCFIMNFNEMHAALFQILTNGQPFFLLPEHVELLLKLKNSFLTQLPG